ncbi:DNA-binding protein [Phyllobacterium bourgognense]|uniref:DNA-binding protein n=1 Tax=Phyllobacterium bourgognense TaxID=314236 RepID=A0A368YIR3_9HYPH|nr:DNA-binding protein [Phyllobacterium bourgognense]
MPKREARNPATRATIKVAAARKLAFTPAKALKDESPARIERGFVVIQRRVLRDQMSCRPSWPWTSVSVA